LDFGKVDTVEGIDFTLPPDHRDTAAVLGPHEDVLKVYTGCGKWGRKEWVGLIYPKGTPERDFFKLYAQHFNSIELNATNYRLPNVATVRGWAQNCEDDFRFCPKLHQSVTKFRRLRGVTGEMSYFRDVMAPLGEKLGPVLVQLPHNLTTKSAEDVMTFIEDYSENLPLAIEFRHASWFESSDASESVFGAMGRHGVCSVITDTAGRRDAVHMRLTSPVVFVRFQGYALHPSDYTRLDDWIARLGAWKALGLQEVYFFMHQDDEAHTPWLCKYFAEQVGEKLGIRMTVPQLNVIAPPRASL
jgi:uncharacterized protein YecE (DUF72 family)